MESREPQPSTAIIHSQSVKTGPSAIGDVGFDARKKVKGRKRHILVDTYGLLLRCEVHGANLQDRVGAVRLFDRLTTRFPFLEVLFADAAGHPQEPGDLSGIYAPGHVQALSSAG